MQCSHCGVIFYDNFIKREIDWYDVMYNFKLKASQLVFDGDFKSKFVDILWHKDKM